MIKTKQDLKYYLESDKIALGIQRKFPRILINQDLIWRFEILLRKCEYYKNNNKNLINKIVYIFHRVRLSNMQIKLGFSIPLNVAISWTVLKATRRQYHCKYKFLPLIGILL